MNTHAVFNDTVVIITLQLLTDADHTAHPPTTDYGLFDLIDPHVESADLVCDIGGVGIEALFERVESADDEG